MLTILKIISYQNVIRNYNSSQLKLNNVSIISYQNVIRNYNRKANILYSFFILILNDGYDSVKIFTQSSTFYRNISELKSIGVDFSQSNFADIPRVDFDKMVDFDPFSWKEVI